jgi:hypothetical protein
VTLADRESPLFTRVGMPAAHGHWPSTEGDDDGCGVVRCWRGRRWPAERLDEEISAFNAAGVAGTVFGTAPRMVLVIH